VDFSSEWDKLTDEQNLQISVVPEKTMGRKVPPPFGFEPMPNQNP
jgi:hypothetical protein